MNFKINSKLSNSFLIVIYVDIFSGLQDISIYTNISKNEKILNGIYYFYIPVKVESTCEPGQYFAVSRYLCKYFKLNIILLSFICMFCPENQYKSYQNNTCDVCPLGGICENGILYNQEG